MNMYLMLSCCKPAKTILTSVSTQSRRWEQGRLPRLSSGRSPDSWPRQQTCRQETCHTRLPTADWSENKNKYNNSVYEQFIFETELNFQTRILETNLRLLATKKDLESLEFTASGSNELSSDSLSGVYDGSKLEDFRSLGLWFWKKIHKKMSNLK